MKIGKVKNELIVLLILFVAIGALFLYNKIDVFISGEGDGYFHAMGGYFVYDFARWWMGSPTFSFQMMKSFVIDYQTHYKFLGSLTHWQPFQSLFVGFLAFFSGKYPFTNYMATALETLAAMFYGYRIFGLIYGEKKKLFLFLVPVFIAFSPIVFDYGASLAIEPAVLLFSTMTVFYFIRYIKAGRTGDLYFTAASFGLGMLTKASFIIVLPILLLSLFLERKHRILFGKYKELAISVVIFLLVISPWLILESIFTMNGISDLGGRIAVLGIYSSLGSGINAILANIGMTIWVTGMSILLVFLVYKLLKSKRLLGEATLLIFAIVWAAFYNITGTVGTIATIQPRLFLPVVPFAVILSVRGIQLFFEQQKRFQRYLIPAVGFILFVSILTCYNYTAQVKIEWASTDILAPAIYISDNIQSPTTVMSTFSRMQAVAFLVLEEKNVSVVEAPYKYSGGEEELKIMLDSKDYVRRPNITGWEKFNLTHPPVGWVIIHEKFDGLEPDYKLKDIIDKRDDFELVQTMEGKWTGNRVFIYKRKPSFYANSAIS
jgi:hypothetical protein